MLRFLSSNQAFKNVSARNRGYRHRDHHRYKHTVAVQLDYYMSSQFAGIAYAMTEGLYLKAGITNLNFLPICPVGLELERVRDHRNSNTDDAVIGSVEQNIFTPILYQEPT